MWFVKITKSCDHCDSNNYFEVKSDLSSSLADAVMI